MDMPGNDTNIEPPNGTEDNVNYHAPNITSMVDSFCPPIWDQPIINGTSWTPNAVLSGSMFSPPVQTMVPSSLPHFPADSCFIERAARFSCFNGGHFSQMVNPSSVLDHPNEDLVRKGVNPSVQEVSKENFSEEVKDGVDLLGIQPDEAECSGGREEFDGTAGEFSGEGVGLKKRKRTEQKNVNNEGQQAGDENPSLTGNGGGKGPDPPREEYIHVRARRGQATNSHSLAERIRREKISLRMKFLQDLVPGCNKVTGKAVMLDEIINYVQSLQRQVEFLSMKLATVNPRLDFDIDGFIAKDIPQTRTGLCLSSSLGFPPDMTMPFTSIQPGLMPISLQTNVVHGGPLREPTSQAPSVWDDELHNVVHNGFNPSAPPNSSNLSGHMKAEP